jgi:excisionase family DNA binding protein
MESFVSATEVAKFLSTSPRTVAKMAREGRIPGHPVSGTARRTWRFKLSEVEYFFELYPPTPTMEVGRPNPAERQQ